MALALDDHERSMLAGDRGEGAALAARLVVRAAEALDAERLIPITRAHVDSCLYHGEATIDFVRRLVDGGASVMVPTTLNVGTLDLLHPELWHGSREVAERGRLLMEAYRSLGCRPTFTCAPYQLADARPAFGEQVAWAESNAIAFCNAVIGARTERYGDFTDIACAVMGRVPDAGLHRDEARRATLALRIGIGRAGATALVRRSLSAAGDRARAARREPSGGNLRPAGPPTRGSAQGAWLPPPRRLARWRCFTWSARRPRRPRFRPRWRAGSRRKSASSDWESCARRATC